jgi:Uma2 family endonuclease
MATVKTPSEQRVVLHNIGWATYERLLADNENNSAPRFAYDRGELEIMSPSPEHEKFNRCIAQLVLAVAEEFSLEAEDLGSTTLDIASPSLNKLPIYAQMGVPEVWRYDGERMTILVLEDSDYAETTESLVLGPVTESALTGFIEKDKSMKRTTWLESVREWARQNTGPSE